MREMNNLNLRYNKQKIRIPTIAKKNQISIDQIFLKILEEKSYKMTLESMFGNKFKVKLKNQSQSMK